MPCCRQLFLVLLPLAFSGGSYARAEELVLLDRRTDAGLVEVIDGQLSYVLNGGGKIQQQALMEVVRWGHPTKPAARPRLVLRDGSLLVTAPVWRKAGAIELFDDVFEIKLASVNPLQVERSAVSHLLLEAARAPELYGEVLHELRSDKPDADDTEPLDRAWLINGDRFEGRLVAIQNSEASFMVADEAIQVAFADLVAIQLASPAGNASAKQSIAVGLKDGTLFKASSVTIGTEEFKLACPLAGNVRGDRSDFVTFVQPMTKNVQYLSDLTPLDYRHTPFTTLAWDYARDANLAGGAITVGNQRYLKGLAMHSASRLVYRAPTNAKRLEAMLAVASPQAGAGQGSVVFRVLVARAAGFEEAYESPIVRDGDPPQPLSIDIAGARAIALLVDYADRGDQGDHAFWLDARMLVGSRN